MGLPPASGASSDREAPMRGHLESAIHQMKQIRLHLPATIGGLLFGFLVCVPARSTEAVKSVDERLRLRNETAIHYDEPSAHLRPRSFLFGAEVIGEERP